MSNTTEIAAFAFVAPEVSAGSAKDLVSATAWALILAMWAVVAVAWYTAPTPIPATSTHAMVVDVEPPRMVEEAESAQEPMGMCSVATHADSADGPAWETLVEAVQVDQNGAAAAAHGRFFRRAPASGQCSVGS